MIYPKFINKNSTIGVCAPSDGITNEAKLKRIDFAIKNFNKLDFNILETINVRKSILGRSASSEVRASELEDLYLNHNVDAIICAAGGDFLLEILPFIDFNLIKENPKWLQGYSDPTGLLFVITTYLDIATIYANNFAAFGMNTWHKSLEDNINILKGSLVTQNSFLKYESSHVKYLNGDETYVLDKNVLWESLNNEESFNFKGRIIGGCIDILSELFGTRFDFVNEFISRYKDDGIIWYFDNCELSSEDLIRTLWRFKDNGWFKYTKGVIFGRSGVETSYYDISFKEAIKYSLSELNVPIIINADIGHVSPRMTIINGAIANICYEKGKGSIEFLLI